MKDISLKQWLISLGVAILMVVACLFIFKITSADTAVKVLTCLCNSFFITGGVVLCFGLLIWCANHGSFTGLSYGFKQIFEKRRFEKQFEKRERYGEYRERKLKNQHEFMHMIIVGLGFVVISFIFLLFIYI